MRHLLLTALLGLATAALAQERPPLDGEWRGWLTSAAGQLEVRLTLKGAGGQLRFFPQPHQQRRNPCWSQVHPVRLGETEAEASTLLVQGSTLGPDCEDSSASWTLKGEELTLSFPTGAQGKLKRR